MTLDPASPVEYLVGHLEDALARDPRVTEQGLHVTVRCHPLVVVVSGTVVSERHQDGLAQVVAELLPEAELCDDTRVADARERSGSEELP